MINIVTVIIKSKLMLCVILFSMINSQPNLSLVVFSTHQLTSSCKQSHCLRLSVSCSPSMRLIALWPGSSLLFWLLCGLLVAREPQCGDGGHAEQHPVRHKPQQLSVSGSCQPSTAQTQPHSSEWEQKRSWVKRIIKTGSTCPWSCIAHKSFSLIS